MAINTVGGDAAVVGADGYAEFLATDGHVVFVFVYAVVFGLTSHPTARYRLFLVGGHIAASAGVDGLDFGGMGMWRAVGSKDAVGAEGIVVLDAWQLAEVATRSPAELRIEN